MAYYGTNSILNIYGSFAHYLDACPAAAGVVKFLEPDTPKTVPIRDALPRYLAYTLRLLTAHGANQKTRLTLYAVAKLSAGVTVEAAKLWTRRTIDAYRRFFLEYAPKLYDYEAVAADAQWLDFLTSGNAAAFGDAFATPPQPIGDLLFHPTTLGEVTSVDDAKVVETVFTSEWTHQAIDNVPTLLGTI